jgi:hypothetical protein
MAPPSMRPRFDLARHILKFVIPGVKPRTGRIERAGQPPHRDARARANGAPGIPTGDSLFPGKAQPSVQLRLAWYRGKITAWRLSYRGERERQKVKDIVLLSPIQLHRASCCAFSPPSTEPYRSSEAGVTIRDSWLAFGDYDVILIVEAPDNVHAAAIAMAVTAGGAVRNYKTTPLMTWGEGIEAMRVAGGSEYRPPGS